ncbi:MAG: PEP-CTERM sorting domain-containing protein [Burkholderiales bacterium]|nr:PEP-CTERM sorting domain-containing protein [Burkholderiales bacterium]MDE2157587.1 PEP-CTERM sorting domain-containing protein [Burkholderiales bacterium]
MKSLPLLHQFLVGATALTASSLAAAALVTGSFDPAFGGALNGISYRGSDAFSIADACLSLPLPGGSGFVYTSNYCGGQPSAMQFLGAQVEFYKTGTDPTLAADILGQVDFGAQAGAVEGMYLQGGRVVGVQTGLIGPVAATSNLGLGGAIPDFSIQFGLLNAIFDKSEGRNPTGPDGDRDLDDLPASDFAQTALYETVGGCQPGAAANGCLGATATATTYTTALPEPGSLALVIAAGAAAAALRRRRR